MARPELKIQVGDRVKVLDRSYREPRIYDAEVVKVSRVWIDLKGTGSDSLRTWRMRQDNQTDGSGVGVPPRFATLEQYAWDLAQSESVAYLLSVGILGDRTPKFDLVKLADLIKRNEGDLK